MEHENSAVAPSNSFHYVYANNDRSVTATAVLSGYLGFVTTEYESLFMPSTIKIG